MQKVSTLSHLDRVGTRDKTNGLEVEFRGDRVRRSQIGKVFDREVRGRWEGKKVLGKGGGMGTFWEEGDRIYFGK